jgi:hypothetical protein
MARDRLHLRRLCGRAADARERFARRDGHRGHRGHRTTLHLDRGIRSAVPAPADRPFKPRGKDDASPPPPQSARARAVAQAAPLRAPVSPRALLPASVPTAAVSSRRHVPRGPLPAALPVRRLAGGAPARLPASLRLLSGARESDLHRGRNPVPPALPRPYERRTLGPSADLMPAAVPPSLHGRGSMSNDRVSPRPTAVAASVPDVQRRQPLLSLSRVTQPGLASARAGQLVTR